MNNLILSFSLFLILSSCSVYENIPTVSFRGPTLQGVQTKIDLQQVKIDLGLRFSFKNPLKMDIVVPEHQFIMFRSGIRFSGSGD